MTLGEKLRQARLEAGLSQRELCGEEITRNMLSQIEHGTARPSMTTLQYLSARLQLPVSYFLEEGAVSSNRGLMDACWEAFRDGKSESAMALLESYRGPDPVYDRERGILRCFVLLDAAEKNLGEGKSAYAMKLLNQVKELETEMPWLPEVKHRRLLLLGRLDTPIPAQELPNLDKWLLLHASVALGAGKAIRAGALLEAVEQRGGKWNLLRGQVAMAQEEYGAAAKYLQEAEEECPKQAIPLLERAFRELGDYRSAYYYACKAREQREQ